MTSYTFRADLFRIACRLASMAHGVRVEPATQGGAIITAWTDELVFALLDMNATASKPGVVRVPHEFIDATTRAVKHAPQPNAVQIRIIDGEATCDHVGLRASNCVREAEIDNWRAWARRNDRVPLVGAIEARCDVLESIITAAKLLAVAGGSSRYDAERASIVFRGGVEGAVVLAFPRFPDAFAIVRDATSPGDAGQWKHPAWLDSDPRVIDFGNAPPEAGLRL